MTKQMSWLIIKKLVRIHPRNLETTTTNQSMGASVGDTFTCFRKHENAGAVQSGNSRMGLGRDLDDAVLVATNRIISDRANQGLVNFVALTFSCENLPNLDTFTRTDGMCVLSKKEG